MFISLCWAPTDGKDDLEANGFNTLNFMAGFFNETTHICQVMNFKLKYNKKYIGDNERIVPNIGKLGSYDMINAMIEATSIVKLNITGMSLFVLKEPHNRESLILRPKYDPKD